MCRKIIALSALLALGNCAQSVERSASVPYPQNLVIATEDETAKTEERDRIERFQRLAHMQGIAPPQVEQVVLPPGSVDFMSGPVPVVRVVFPERAFFAFDSSTPLPESGPIFDLIAANMKRDVPDAALTVLGHTDAIGSDTYNIGLSRRRAQAVMMELVARGVNPDRLTEVAIGKRQPIAPNDTVEGRAFNRRVEFLISASMTSNLAAVQQYVVPESYFRTGQPMQVSVRLPSVANVYQLKKGVSPKGAGASNDDLLRPLGGLPLSPVSKQSVASASLAPNNTTIQPPQHVTLAPTMPIAPPQMVPISPVEPREISPTGFGPNSY